MLRQINVNVLIDLNITAHQYILAIYLMHKQYGHMEKYLKESKSYDAFPDDLTRLAQESLVSYISGKEYDFKSIMVQSKFLSTLSKDDIFIEVFELYPLKATRPDGVVHYLRRNKRTCKDMYSIITKSDLTVHKHIMSCLEFELKYRKKNGLMQWMKTMENWLLGREWENYEDVMDDDTSQKSENTYGHLLE